MAEVLKHKIADDIKTALKKSEELRLSTLRLLAAAIANKEIELRKKDVGLSDQEILDIIASEAKKRKDAAAEYQNGGREDLAKKETEELKILREYLPPEISDDDLLRIVKDGMREAGGSDFGKIMKIIMPTLKGKASGERISKALKDELRKAA